MLEMLPEVLCAVELLTRVAFTEFVYVLKMTDTLLPVIVRDEALGGLASGSGEFFTAETTSVHFARFGCAVVESSIITLQS